MMIGGQKTYGVQLTFIRKKAVAATSDAYGGLRLRSQNRTLALPSEPKSYLRVLRIQIGRMHKSRKASVVHQPSSASGVNSLCNTRSVEEAPRPGRPRIFQAIVRTLIYGVRASRCRRHRL